QKVQDEYDTKTDHGRKQTPPTVIDLSAQCADAGTKSSEAGGEGMAEGGEMMAKRELTVSAPDDPYEKGAEEVSEQIMQMETEAAVPAMRTLRRATVQRCAACDGERDEHRGKGAGGDELCDSCRAKQGMIQRHEGDGAQRMENASPLVDRVLASGGRP